MFSFPEPISIGRTSITYSSPNDFNLSFKSKDKVTVFSKAASETSDDVWFVEINGKSGYAPKKFIVEERVIVSSAKLITVQNVATDTLPSTTKPGNVPNINESLPDVNSAETVNNSSEAPVTNENEVQIEEPQQRIKRSIDEPSLASKTVDASDNVAALKPDQVKIEDLNEYDSKNFVESAEGDDDEEEGEEEEDEDEYDDAENSIDRKEEEIRKPVIEEQFVKKTAYVTTDSKVERTDGSDNDEPTLEIMAPTQAEIAQLKQKEPESSKQEAIKPTPPAVNPSVDSENVTVQSTTTSESGQTSSEKPFTTTTVPNDAPQNPLDIPIETTSPIPDATVNQPNVDVSKQVDVKVESVPTTSLTSDALATNNDSIAKVDASVKETLKPEQPPNPTDEIVSNDQVPPFKPLPSSVDNLGNELNDSTTTTAVPNIDVPVVDQTNDVKEPPVIQEPVKPLTPLSDVNPIADEGTTTVATEEKQTVMEDEAQPTESPDVIDQTVNNFEVNNDSLPIEASAEEYAAEPQIKDADVIVDSLNTASLPLDSNDTISERSYGTTDTEIVSPLEILSSTDDIPTADYTTQKVNEGVGVIEPILPPHKIDEQQQAQQADNNNSQEQSEYEESNEGIFDKLIDSVRNLFVGSSTVESLVEDEPADDNFDKALNDILFSQAASAAKKVDDEGTFLLFIYPQFVRNSYSLKITSFQPLL